MASPKESFEALKKLRILDYFGRFDVVMRFLQIMCVVFVAIAIFSTGSALWFYSQATEKTKEITALVKTTRQYLEQQEIQNIFVFSIRLAADYFSMSSNNAKEVSTRLAMYLHKSTFDTTNQELNAYVDILVRGDVTQTIEKIAYDQVSITTVETNDNSQQWFVKIPVKVFVSKEGAEKTTRYETQFGMYLIRSEKSLTNPFGLQILNMGKIQEEQTR